LLSSHVHVSPTYIPGSRRWLIAEKPKNPSDKEARTRHSWGA